MLLAVCDQASSLGSCWSSSGCTLSPLCTLTWQSAERGSNFSCDSYVSTNPINEGCTLMASFGSLSLYLLIPYKRVITYKCFNIFWENMTFSNHHSYPDPCKWEVLRNSVLLIRDRTHFLTLALQSMGKIRSDNALTPL